jgi:hypothetical protein
MFQVHIWDGLAPVSAPEFAPCRVLANESTTPQQQFSLQPITKARASKVGLKYYSNIRNRKACTTLPQPIAVIFGKVISPYYKCGYGKETVRHFLLVCRPFNNERRKLTSEVGTGRIKISRFLGNETMVSHTMEYISDTGRPQTR